MAERLLGTRRPFTEPDLAGGLVDWDDALASFRRGRGRPTVLGRDRAQEIARDHPSDVERLLEAGNRAVECTFGYFGYPEVTLQPPVDWHYDPVAAIRWPALPSTQIDHRTAKGDVKWIWELNRLQHLPWLAQSWLFTGDEIYSSAAFTQLDTWLVQNPPGQGIAWRGAFEAGIRAISVAVALQGLRESPGLTRDRFRSVTLMLAESARRCWVDRSLYSSANNHLVGEMAGLATVAILFPELAMAPKWERRAVAALVRESDRQILADGAGAEQAVGYQVFTAELILLVASLLKARDGAAPAAMVDAVSRSAWYLASIVGPRDPDPRYGDDDEGFALRLGPESVRTVRDHLAIVAAFLGNSALRALGNDSITAKWLGSAVQPKAHRSVGSRFAPDGGMVVLRARKRRVMMDIGPLGYLSIAAHGHADALAVTVSLNGTDVIGDPGAGSYYGNPSLRRVHRGTRVHATVEVDGCDQSVSGGPFLWRQHARVRCRAVDLEAGIVDAEHDGYRRLRRPVVHRRWLIAPPDDEIVLVIDLLTGKGAHDAVVSWPLAPSVRAVKYANGYNLDCTNGPAVALAFASTVDIRSDDVRGDKVTNLGWWSERLERPVPSSLLSMHGSGQLPIAFVTAIETAQQGSRIEGLRIERSRRVILLDWRCGANWHALEIATDRDGAVTSRSGKVAEQ